MVSGKTRVFCVVGDPVDHSLSPFIMNRAFAELGFDATYIAFRLPAKRLGKAVAGMRSLGFRGSNVTYPLKELILRFVNLTSPAVNVIGAANLLTFTKRGVEADNTDALGTVTALENFGAVDPTGKTALVYGAGGAARAAACGLLSAGARGVVFVVRDPERAKESLSTLTSHFADADIDIVAWEHRDGAANRVDILINATPLGMIGVEPAGALVDEDALHESQCCFDFVYHPLETEFLAVARRRGAIAVDGLALLVAQALEAFKRWTGEEFSLHEMYTAARAYAADARESRS